MSKIVKNNKEGKIPLAKELLMISKILGPTVSTNSEKFSWNKIKAAGSGFHPGYYIR